MQLLTTRKVKKLDGLVLQYTVYSVYFEMYIANRLCTRSMKTIIVCTFYKAFFVVGIYSQLYSSTSVCNYSLVQYVLLTSWGP